MNRAGKPSHIHMIVNHMVNIVVTLTLCVCVLFVVFVSPVVLSLTDSVLEGNFVLATLSDDPNHRKNNPRR